MAPTITRRTLSSTALTVPVVHGTLSQKGDTITALRQQRSEPSYQLAAQAAQARQAGSGGFGPYLTQSEAGAVLASLPPESSWGTLCRFLWQSGARSGEALKVTRADINLRAATVRCETTKQHPDPKTGQKKPPKFREVPIQADLVGFLALHMAGNEIGERQRLWPWSRQHMSKEVSRIMREAGVAPERCHPHAFRHGFAVNCIEHGVPLKIVQDCLGHADIKTTAIYLQFSLEDRKRHLKGVTF